MDVEPAVRALAGYASAAASTARDALTVKGWRGQTPPTGHARYDLPLTDHYAPRVHAALAALYGRARIRAAAVTARQVAPLTVKGHRHGVPTDPHRAVTSSTAQGALRAATPRDAALLQAVRDIWVDAWVAGGHVGAEQVGADATLGAAGQVIAELDWTDWAPGDGLAAAKTADGALADLLDRADVTVQGLTETTIRDLGDAIAECLLRGYGVDAVAGLALGLLDGDTDRAVMIAHTETARALTAATLDVYVVNGIRQWEWATASGACPLCLAAESANPHDLGDGPPPGHPMCRCTVKPHLPTVPGIDGYIDLGDIETA